MHWQDIWKISVTLHIVFVSVWLGGNILLFFVGPKIRHADFSVKREINRTFKVLSWGAFFGLLMTGVFNLIFRAGGDTFNMVKFLLSNPFFKTKIFLVFVLGISKFFHDFVFGPRARGRDIWFYLTYSLAIANTGLLFAIVYLAVRFVRG